MYIRDRVWNFIKSSDSVLSFVLSLGLGHAKTIPKIWPLTMGFEWPDPAQISKIAFLAQKLIKNLRKLGSKSEISRGQKSHQPKPQRGPTHS